jgi:hypothetical protein
LLELGRHLESAEQRGVHPSKLDSQYSAANPMLGPQNDADKLVLDWCNTHGLLGLVPVLSTSIRVNDNVRHYRDGGRWFSDILEEEIRGSRTMTWRTKDSGDQDSVTTPVRGDGNSNITWLSWLTREYESTPLVKKRAFFGALSPGETFTPWRPWSQAFWKMYGEPVQEIADWSITFTHCADALSRSREVEDHLLHASHGVLSRLADSAAPRFRLYPTRSIVLDEERTPAGLLASYAQMLLWDFVEGRRALRCKNCKRYFVSDEYRAAYCSPRCRNTAQSRRYRAKKEVGD